MSTKNIVLASGGIDSMVLAYLLRAKGEDALLMHFDFGDKARKGAESMAVHLTAESLRYPVETVSVSGIVESLLKVIPVEDFVMDEGHRDSPSIQEDGRIIYRTSGFPVLLAVATHYARVRGIPRVQVGIEGDQARRNKGLRSFVGGWSTLMYAFDSEAPDVEIVTPFLNMSKSDVLRLGVELGAPIHHSWSCLRNHLHHCGRCEGCVARQEAFEEAKITDLTRYDRLSPSQQTTMLLV